MPTCALAKIKLDVASWKDARAGEGSLESFITPKSLPERINDRLRILRRLFASARAGDCSGSGRSTSSTHLTSLLHCRRGSSIRTRYIGSQIFFSLFCFFIHS